MRFRISLLFIIALVSVSVLHATPSIDELPDLTGAVIPLLSYDTGEGFGGGGQLFTGGQLSSRGEIRYRVRLKNQTGDPIEADSLVVVVHKIQEMARLRDVTTELEVVGSDGYTDDGKPFFRVPVGGQPELEPFGESEAITIEIRNPDLLRLYPPVLRVRGMRRTASQAFQDERQILVRKGVLSPEEARDALNKPLGDSP